jgi:hypothetical protein
MYCFKTLQDLFCILHLSGPDLVMNLAEGLAIGGTDGVLNGWLLDEVGGRRGTVPSLDLPEISSSSL